MPLCNILQIGQFRFALARSRLFLASGVLGAVRKDLTEEEWPSHFRDTNHSVVTASYGQSSPGFKGICQMTACLP